MTPMTASIKALILMTSLMMSLCASVTLAASEVDVEMKVNDLSSPIFINGCKPLPDMPWAERYRGVMLIYSAGKGWLVGIRDDMTIEPFGTSGYGSLKPFSWDLMGGVWSIMSTAAGICTGAAAQKCTTGSVVACPRSPWEGPARGATRPPRGWRRPARGRGLWAHGVKRGVIRTVAGVVTGSA